jgi:hypothetical protein
MADPIKKRRLQARPLPIVSGDRRLNSLNYGHLGRLTYQPEDEDEAHFGRLHTSRNPEARTSLGDSNQDTGRWFAF